MVEILGCNKMIMGRWVPQWPNPCGEPEETITGCYNTAVTGRLVPTLDGEAQIGDCPAPPACMKLKDGRWVPVLEFAEYDTLEELQEACCGGQSSSGPSSSGPSSIGPSSSEPSSSGPSSSEPSSSSGPSSSEPSSSSGPSSSEPSSSGPSSSEPSSSSPFSWPESSNPAYLAGSCCYSVFGGSIPRFARVRITGSVSCCNCDGLYVLENTSGGLFCIWGGYYPSKGLRITLNIGGASSSYCTVYASDYSGGYGGLTVTPNCQRAAGGPAVPGNYCLPDGAMTIEWNI